MSISSKAIWQIESRTNQPITLITLSELCAVSPYHLSRTFRLATGMSPMAYLRARRLSNAADCLANGSDSILSIALDAQYGSHEAFTRAFTSYFGVVPKTVRLARSTKNLKLQEPIEMDKSRIVPLPAPQIKDNAAFKVVGLSVKCSFANTSPIPPLWQAFNEREDEVAAAPAAAYGICHSADPEGNFEYLAGMEATKGTEIPQGMKKFTVPAGRYAVFTHNGHISEIGNSVYTIWNKSLPDLGLTPRQAPDFERYDNRFDPKTGRGPVEIWIPVSD